MGENNGLFCNTPFVDFFFQKPFHPTFTVIMYYISLDSDYDQYDDHKVIFLLGYLILLCY